MTDRPDNLALADQLEARANYYPKADFGLKYNEADASFDRQAAAALRATPPLDDAALRDEVMAAICTAKSLDAGADAVMALIQRQRVPVGWRDLEDALLACERGASAADVLANYRAVRRTLQDIRASEAAAPPAPAEAEWPKINRGVAAYATPPAEAPARECLGISGREATAAGCPSCGLGPCNTGPSATPPAEPDVVRELVTALERIYRICETRPWQGMRQSIALTIDAALASYRGARP